ncbi:MAG: hypothetical protein JXB05_10680, partial [Myxococcaceae bacterium]|nr:hypothetical protein [Myxococcaceae bacterium]
MRRVPLTIIPAWAARMTRLLLRVLVCVGLGCSQPPALEPGMQGGVVAPLALSEGVVPLVNNPPTANDDSSTMEEDSAATPLEVQANDTTAPDTGDSLTITAVTQP